MDERLLNVNEHGVLAVDAGAVMLMLAAARHSILLLITLMTGLSAALLDVIAPDAFAASLVLLDSLALAVALTGSPWRNLPIRFRIQSLLRKCQTKCSW